MPVASAAPAAADDLSSVRRSIPVVTILVMSLPLPEKFPLGGQVLEGTLTALPILFDIRTNVRFSASFNDRLGGVNHSLAERLHETDRVKLWEPRAAMRRATYSASKRSSSPGLTG